MIFNIFRHFMAYSCSKVAKTTEEAIAGLKSGDFLFFGGFGLCGVPMNLISAISETNLKDLVIASNQGGAAQISGQHGWGLQFLLKSNKVKRIISSYMGFNKHGQAMYLNGSLQLEFCPQGTLAEKIRSGGAGIGGFYTKTGVDTLVQTGGIPIKYIPGTQIPEILSKPKQIKIINGKKYLYEESYFADFAFVKAEKADRYGNLVFRKTARNFNEDMAKAATCVVAEVEQIVQNGQIDPEHIHVPGVYVDRIFKADRSSIYSEKKFQRLTYSGSKKIDSNDKNMKAKLKIMKRAAQQIYNGANVNLGVGIPTLLPACLPSDIHINIHGENGIIGIGPYPCPGNEDPDLINAGKQTITLLSGGSYFSSSQSFSIIRGSHLDITMLGALQVSKTGDISNWMIPGKMAKGMGGAMDLVNSGSKVIVVMQHTADKAIGKSKYKLVEKCWLPITGKQKVSKVITEKAVFENINGELILTEVAEGMTVEQIQSQTGFEIKNAEEIKTF